MGSGEKTDQGVKGGKTALKKVKTEEEHEHTGIHWHDYWIFTVRIVAVGIIFVCYMNLYLETHRTANEKLHTIAQYVVMICLLVSPHQGIVEGN